MVEPSHQSKRFILGECRGQSTILPESLDDYASDTNPVWVVDVFQLAGFHATG